MKSVGGNYKFISLLVTLPSDFFDNLWQPDPYFLNSKVAGEDSELNLIEYLRNNWLRLGLIRLSLIYETSSIRGCNDFRDFES